MDKNAIKKYAVWARNELIARVSQKALQYGITMESIVDADADSVNGKVLTATEKKQRQALIAQVEEKGFEQVMEEVAYTWFNRFSALRFMEVNGYLPSHVRVFTDDENHFKPQILTEAIHLELDGLDMEKVYEFKEADKTEELFKYLLIVQCNALNSILPGMFQKLSDYTELLLPDNLLREGSVVEQLIVSIPEEDWKDAVQIIGWLYQYYNSEKKDDVFAALKKNVKITKENIPAATQLFTPDWIVRYMVENSLGRLWLEGHPDAKEQLLPTEEEQAAYVAGNREPDDRKWHYYLEEAQQEPEVQEQLAAIREEYKKLKPEEILCIDPCSGSGHIISYMFDALMSIYESYGYTTREAVASIVENNIYGLDIDDRAAQLAYFSVMMKARQYDRRFFSREIQPHVYAIVESNHVDQFAVDYFCNGDSKLKKAMDTIIAELHDAKEYGSILTVTPQDWFALYERFEEISNDIHMSRETALRELLPLVQVAEALAQKYDAVVTNPPYMGGSGMGAKLSDYVKKNYPDSKSDMSTVCMEKTLDMCSRHGFMAMINIPVWMFISSYEKLRFNILSDNTIRNMVHLGRGVFGSDFGTTAFIIHKTNIPHYTAHYRRLFINSGDVDTIETKEKCFFERMGQFYFEQNSFFLIPTQPVAYWASRAMLSIFAECDRMGTYAEGRKGLVTGNDDVYLKLWHEVCMYNFSAFGGYDNTKWKPCNKGGNYRKWYGNNDYIVNWGTEGKELANHRWPDGRQRSSLRNSSYFFREGLTWTYITSGTKCFRYYPEGFAFAGTGPGLFPKNNVNLWYILAYTNSVVFDRLLKLIGSSTISLESGEVERAPIYIRNQRMPEINELAKNNTTFAKTDWDSFETSWDFQRHPLVREIPSSEERKVANSQGDCSVMAPLEYAYTQWMFECDDRFNQLKANEEELNRIFIDIYGLQDELTPEVEEKDVTVRKADLQRDIKSLISYAVGCMFGRYSLDVDGLAYAGGEWDNSKYASFAADKDNIIPICDDEYFEDDIVGRFVEWVETVYGKETLNENLKFIADALGGKGHPKDVIRNYFMNDFYSDHCKMYQKRPIYWQFDSGKKNGFKCLIYMHRYQPDTIARIRTDYVHEQQSRYRTAMEGLEKQIAGAATGERVKLNKRLKALQDQAAEIHTYEEKIHHLADQMISIDLDDGVKKNYEIFKDVLAKIK